MKSVAYLVMLTFFFWSCSSTNSKIEKPNILFCIMDDTGMHMSAYDTEWCQTPLRAPAPQAGLSTNFNIWAKMVFKN